MIEGHSLNPMTKDVYFLTILSRRGELVNLRTFPLGPFNIVDYIGMHWEVGTKKIGSQVPIKKITKFSLKAILLLIGWITGFTTLHQTSPGHMYYAMQCLDAQMFYWSMTMLTCMKRQLTECHGHSNKNFRLDTIL